MFWATDFWAAGFWADDFWVGLSQGGGGPTPGQGTYGTIRRRRRSLFLFS